MKEIALNNSPIICLVDDGIHNILSQHTWNPIKARSGIFYAIANIKTDETWRSCRMHRLVMGITNPSVYVDHIDHNGLNNQRANL